MKVTLHTLILLLAVFAFSCSMNDPQVIQETDIPEATAKIRQQEKSLFEVALPSQAEAGVMLHAHTWPFKDIEKAIPDIAAAGFNSVQVSPVNKTKGSTPWWILYQPCDLGIGNMVLGSEADFRSLCNTAEDHGVKIIVDAVLNHVGDNGTSGQWANELDPALKQWRYFHRKGQISNWQDRWQITQQDLLGLPDWNTQSREVQDLHINFLNKCIDAGADGFRFDAAKHMETSGGEDGNWAGNYWEHVLGNLKNKSSLYLFGEVLPDVSDNEAQYLKYYDLTAHGYGRTLRRAVRDNNVTDIQNIWHGGQLLPPNKSLVYVENHDDFEHNDDNSKNLNTWQRKMGFAIAAARAGVTPRLLDRPGGEDVWKDPDVTTINRFHNAMVGQNEYLRYPRQQTLVVDRGSKGTAIINLGDAFSLTTSTSLQSGTYSGNPGTFNVSNGTLTGQVPGGAIVVLYDGKSYGNGGSGGGGGGDAATTTVYAHYNVGWGNTLYIRGDGGPLNWNSGIQMTNVDVNTWMWQTTDFPSGQKLECKVLINDNQWASNSNWWLHGGETIDIYPDF